MPDSSAAQIDAEAPAAEATESRFGPKGDARRRRLIEAGYRIVLDQGMAGLTFRAVASGAKVPLGSASYYFSDKNALLLEVIRFARARVLARYHRTEERILAGVPWIEALADHVAHVTGEDQRALARDYEMFLYGFDHPDLTETSKSWITQSNPSLRRILPPDLLAPVSYMLEGMFLTSAKTGQRFSTEEVQGIFRHLVQPGSDTVPSLTP